MSATLRPPALALWLLAVALAWPACPASAAADLVVRIYASDVEGLPPEARGAGLLLGRDQHEAYVATADHLFDYGRGMRAQVIAVAFHGMPEARIEARLVYRSDDRDLAFLALDRNDLPQELVWPELQRRLGRPDRLIPGNRLDAIGMPGGRSWVRSPESELVAGVDDEHVRIVSRFTGTGYSGGGAFTRDGHLMAMVERGDGDHALLLRIDRVLEEATAQGIPVELAHAVPGLAAPPARIEPLEARYLVMRPTPVRDSVGLVFVTLVQARPGSVVRVTGRVLDRPFLRVRLDDDREGFVAEGDVQPLGENR